MYLTVFFAAGDEVKSVHSGEVYEVSDLGIMHPNECSTNAL
jgi:translation elongation factor EF-4